MSLGEVCQGNHVSVGKLLQDLYKLRDIADREIQTGLDMYLTKTGKPVPSEPERRAPGFTYKGIVIPHLS